MISRYFHLGESPLQVLERQWWDVLGMAVALHFDQLEEKRIREEDAPINIPAGLGATT